MSREGFEFFFDRLQRAGVAESQSELARLLGLGRAAVSLAKRKNKIPDRWVLDIAQRYGLNPVWLKSGLGEARAAGAGVDAAEFVSVPKVAARLSAGGGSFETGGEVEDRFSFRSDWIHSKGAPERMVLMEVVGNSMEPELKEGDLALIDESKQNVLAGGVYAVGVEDTVMVKRVEKRPGALVLHSDNPDYSPIVFSGQELEAVRIVGKVIWIGREYR
ncbi:MAG: S24 family peptidase [Desulfovibrionaceae bacterium]